MRQKMFKNRKIIDLLILVLLGLALSLGACNRPTNSGIQPLPDTPAQDAAPPPDSDAVAPVDDQPAPEPPAPDLVDAATFIEHTTIPTGTILGQGQVFTKTWELENSGTTTWTPDYFLEFDRGDQMAGPDDQPLFEYFIPEGEEVLPGDLITVTVILTSPLQEGEYLGFWQFRNPDEEIFGAGPEADEPVEVDIEVRAGAWLDPSAGGAPAAGTGTVENVELTVTPADYAGDCPVQLIFSGAIEVDGLGPYEYEYTSDVNTDLPGWEYLIPAPNQFSYDSPGWHVYQTNFVIDIPADADGWIRLDGHGPGSSSFSEIYYNVDCNE